jgi:putative glutamine amidotransferase
MPKRLSAKRLRPIRTPTVLPISPFSYTRPAGTLPARPRAERRLACRPVYDPRISRRRFLRVFPGLLATWTIATGCTNAEGRVREVVPAGEGTTDPVVTPVPAATPTEAVLPATAALLASATPEDQVTATPDPVPTATFPSCAESVPVIGIVAHHFHAQSHQSNVDGQIAAYRRAISSAGGAPVLIPLALDEMQWRAIYSRLDGLLLPGGVDVDPVHYGEPPHPQLGKVDSALDEAELVLARWALADNLPLLGICRGAQLLNVAAGGSLVQDIPSQWTDALVHATSAVNAHHVAIRPGNRLAEVLGVETCMTNSRHHQAAKDLGPGFVVTATTSDGVIEALERVGAAFCIGVQWHPENLVEHDPVMLRLFVAFVAAAAAHGARCLP